MAYHITFVVKMSAQDNFEPLEEPQATVGNIVLLLV